MYHSWPRRRAKAVTLPISLPGRTMVSSQVEGRWRKRSSEGVADEVLVFAGEMEEWRGEVDRLGHHVAPGVADKLAGVEGGGGVIGRTGEEAGEENGLVVFGGLDAAVAGHVVLMPADGFAREFHGARCGGDRWA